MAYKTYKSLSHHVDQERYGGQRCQELGTLKLWGRRKYTYISSVANSNLPVAILSMSKERKDVLPAILTQSYAHNVGARLSLFLIILIRVHIFPGGHRLNF